MVVGERGLELPERPENTKVSKRLHRSICGCFGEQSKRWMVRSTEATTSSHRYQDRWPLGESKESLVEVCCCSSHV